MKSSAVNVYVSHSNCVSPLGFSLKEHELALLSGKSAISEVFDPELSKEKFYAAIINSQRIESAFKHLPYKGDFTRLEKLMLLAVYPCLKNFSRLSEPRCGLIISTTKGNIDHLGEQEEKYYLSHLAKNLGKSLGITKDPIVLSNACVSGIMAVSIARRLIQMGHYDHFIIIAADIFSKFVFSGFQSFQAISSEPCRPYSKNRKGITLGEAAAAMIVTKDPSPVSENGFRIVADSSINDANHISGPSRTGEGLFQSVENTMAEAQLNAQDIDYISAHGTATIYNDEMEAQAFSRAGLSNTPLASLKGCFGHTLGAAGLLETVLTLRFAEKNILLPSYGFDESGLTLPLNVLKKIKEADVKVIMKTASGFGGSNTAVIFKRD